MKTKILNRFFLLLMATFVLSCSDDDDNGPDQMEADPMMVELNIVETAQDTESVSSLVAALAKADESASNNLISTLSDETTNFTVLAPTNDAFTDLLARLDGFDSLDDFNTEQLQNLLATVLTYHVVGGAAVTSSALTEGQVITTVQGEDLTVSISGGVYFTDAAGEAAQVTLADVETTNGIIHLIDKILLPQAAIDALSDILLSSITDLAIATPTLSNLVAALQAADGDLPAVLAGEGPFTVFAPTDDAFATFLSDNGFASLSDVPVDVLTQVLLNHVVSGANFSTDLTAGYISTLSTAGVGGNNLSMLVDLSNSVTLNGVSNVTAPDNKAINGVVHIVDAVIGLPNIVDHAVANPNLSELVGALTMDGNTTFTTLLSDSETDFTVFAPVNAAFTAFMNPNSNDLNAILANHVIAGAAAFSSGLTNSYVTTAATNADGDNLSMYINTDDGVTINGASTVAAADIVATNGVIHAVDAVIDLPTVVTFAVADPNFSTLVTALTELTPATDFAGILSRSEGGNTDGINPDFTVFAPTNAAFEALAEIPGEDVLTQVLLHHVVAGANVRSTDLTADGDTMATTLEGDSMTITLPGTGDHIADVTDGAGNSDIGIIAVDVQANNGVIHVLNKVMLPDTMN
ncbi:fasciclin domain-containing protein [Maribacter polysiphoniae]|uniref:Fasciclin domain-containing protein n=1 Tax=Maribacter polysiphoniae TaxID=429344 RepID=A0A316E1H7_9FLAO|nr:fasciclin domain-containing protein [Maribacter polysiphoniae]MBD1260887.1 fasciclin domain-containing protein [Maribacter polysiphoniae]PWK23975.1 putative surface protein with fasciclin (FAS1) repeats [Maribacter polysiphoniae]